jgi:acetyl esterase/lipase
MLLHYPTGNCNVNHFFPATMLTIDDPLLSLNLMMYICSAIMRKGGNPAKNFLLSPIYTPLSVLKEFPPTRMLIAEIDPVRDNGVYMAS